MAVACTDATITEVLRLETNAGTNPGDWQHCPLAQPPVYACSMPR